jgi:hypothetical protein
MQGPAQVDRVHSMATTGRQTAMLGKHLRTLAAEPHKLTGLPRRVIAIRRRTIALPHTRQRVVRAIQPRDPTHRLAATSLRRPTEAFPAGAPSQLPAPREEASPVDIRAPLEGAVPEAGDVAGSPRGVFAHEMMPFRTAYKISSARLCRFSFS